MRWHEVDLNRAEWIIPAERSKNGSEHAVDLAPAAIAILRTLPREHALVFTTTGVTPLSNHAKYRQCVTARMRQLAAEEAQRRGEQPRVIADWRVHDLRRTAATGMVALKAQPYVVEAVLNHRSGTRGGLVAVYQHHDHREERKAALFAWAKRVSESTENCSPRAAT